VGSLTQIAAGVLDSRVGWQAILATEPPIDLLYISGAIGAEDRLPALGPWHPVPPECTDPAAAARWARANVAADLEPPAPDREALTGEPRRLAAIGGPGFLERLHADGLITRPEAWPGDLWWFETTTGPFEPSVEEVDAAAGALASVIGARF
jgi:hypothetical protein